jgi:hypothetical protein
MSAEAATLEIPKVETKTEASGSEAIAETMSPNAVIGVFATHTEAEEAVKALEKNGFPMRRLSIIGKGYHTEEKPIGFYSTGDRVKTW